jgi:hypothetical protein
MLARLKRIQEGGKENNFMQRLPFVDEEFLEGSLMGHGVWGSRIEEKEV